MKSRTQTFNPHTRDLLEEAIREIHLIAGLGDEDRNSARHLAIGVTSPDYGDGKTTIAMALAASLSHDFGTDVTLVDADFHTNSIAQEYGLAGSRGLAEVLTGKVPVAAATHRLPGGTMKIVPAGMALANPARLARSGTLTPAFDEMKSFSSHIVVDLPATLKSMNAPMLAQSCDAVIVVVRHGKTTRVELDRTLHLLKGANVIGVVVNRHRSNVPGWAQRALGFEAQG